MNRYSPTKGWSTGITPGIGHHTTRIGSVKSIGITRGGPWFGGGGIVGDHVIGPFFFHERVNGVVYENFLREDLPGLLEDLPLNLINNMWWMQDGAPAHRANDVVQFLNEIFPQRWIGLRGPMFWPPYSPDVTPMDFFLWGFVKEYMYQRNPRNRNDCENLIRAAFQQVTVQMLRRTIDSFQQRVQLCTEVLGSHFENIVKCRQCNIFRPIR